MKKRISNYDLWKYLMAFFIVLFHQRSAFSLYDNNDLFIFLGPIISSSLCIFAMLTGYLKSTSKNYNYLPIFLTIICCWILNLILQSSLYSIFEVPTNVNYSEMILGGRDWWYIWSFLLMQPLVKYLNLFLGKIDKWSQILIIVILFLFLYWEDNKFVVGQKTSYFDVIWLSTFYLVGGWIRLNWKFKKGLATMSFTLFPFLIFYIILTILNVKYNKNLAQDTHLLETYLLAILLFLFLISIPDFNIKFFNFLGSLSLYIYLFHYLLQVILTNYVLHDFFINLNNPSLQCIIFATIIFIFTTILAIGVRYINDFFVSYFSTKIYKFIEKKKNQKNEKDDSNETQNTKVLKEIENN